MFLPFVISRHWDPRKRKRNTKPAHLSRLLLEGVDSVVSCEEIGFAVVLVEGIVVGFVVDFGIPCLAFVVVGFVVVEIVEVTWESEGNRIGVGYRMKVSKGLTKKMSWGSSHRGGSRSYRLEIPTFFG
ncbi:hypothetical protein Tco_0872470 [Tanacetum coccineum]